MSQSDELQLLREELRRAEQATRLAAFHDSFTGLPNRRLLDDRLTQGLHFAQRHGRMVAVLLLQLDGGGKTGEAALRDLAQRLVPCLRKVDTLARTGSDELAVVLCDLRDEAECRVVVERLGDALGAMASIGIALYPAHGGDSEALLRNAETARSRARQLGRNQFLFYGR